MSSAIEVLKGFLTEVDSSIKIDTVSGKKVMTVSLYNALGEALLALEQKEKIEQIYKDSFQVKLYYYNSFNTKTTIEYFATKEKAKEHLAELKEDSDYDEEEDEWSIDENIFNAEYFGNQVKELIRELEGEQK